MINHVFQTLGKTLDKALPTLGMMSIAPVCYITSYSTISPYYSTIGDICFTNIITSYL